MPHAAPGFDPERFAGRLAPAGAALAVGGGCLGGWGGLLVAAVGLALLILSCASRADGLLVLGPFVRAELNRAARSRRPRLWRVVYALAAGLILAGNVYVYAPDAFGSNPQKVPIALMADVNARVTVWFAVVLFGYVSLLTVQLVAPVVAEEREGKRWDILLTTDLRTREILFGKIVGRLPLVLDPVLASLPVLAVTPLLGGASPTVVLGLAAATLATVGGLAGVAAFYSLFAPTTGKATESVAGAVFLYLGVAPLFYFLQFYPRVWLFPAVGFPVTVGDVVAAMNAGHPIAAVVTTLSAVKAGAGTFDDVFLAAVGRYVAFQGAVLAFFGLTAVARLRAAVPWTGPGAAVSAVGNKGAAKALAKKSGAARRRPPVGDDPVYWWGRYGELTPIQLWHTNRATWAGNAFLAMWLVPVFAAVWPLESRWPWGPGYVKQFAAGLVRVLLVIPAFPMVIAPMVRAARSVAQERTADTLEGLRLTALTDRDILYQKWRAAAESEMPLFRLTLAVGVAGVVTGLVPPLGLLAILVFCPAGSMVAAAVGLAASAWSRTPTGAVTRVIVLGFLSYPCCYISPPAAVGVALWSDQSRKPLALEDYGIGVLAVVALLAWYAVVGFAAWGLAGRWFRR